MKCKMIIYKYGFMEICNLSYYEIEQGYYKIMKNDKFEIYYSPIYPIKINRYKKLGYREM